MDAKQFLSKLVSFQSVSTQQKYSKQLQDNVFFLQKKFEEAGFKVNIIPTKKHPLLFASLENGNSETYGFYSHYDVQPPEPLDQWKTSPFELTETDGKLFGRGTADDKGHIAQVLFAVKQALAKKKLNKNIFLIYEGEEEIGSQNFEDALLTIQERLKKANVFFILDSSTRDVETPMIEYGLRGLLYYELTVTLSHKDLHSGLYGNLVANPANELTQFLGSIKDAKGHVTISHFYDSVLTPSNKEVALLKKTKPSKDQDIKGAGVQDLVVPKGSHFALASKVLPSFDINGMVSGYTGEGAKTIIPGHATAKFSFRLVPHQDPAKVNNLIQKYTQKFFEKKSLTYKLNLLSSDFPFLTLPDNKYIHITKKIFSKHFKNETLLNRSGGSIPAADTLSRLTKKPVVITGFTSPESNLHSPNEFIDSRLFQKGIKVIFDLLTK